jgi:cell division septum initiation protein DivIVA
MEKTTELIDGIYAKVKLLITNINSQKQENQKLKDEIAALKNSVEDHKKTIVELKEKNRNIIIAKAVKPGEGSNDVKVKINDLVREIDKCIGLLNN